MRREITIDGDVAFVKLNGGMVAKIDAADAAVAAGFIWSVLRSKQTNYARRGIRLADGKHKTLLLHREVMRAPEGSVLDHINGDGLDCRRANLRFVTQQQNCLNTRRRANNKCGFKGVRKHSLCNKYQASIQLAGQRRYLGLFETAEAAHAAYIKASAELHKEFGRTA